MKLFNKYGTISSANSSFVDALVLCLNSVVLELQHFGAFGSFDGKGFLLECFLLKGFGR